MGGWAECGAVVIISCGEGQKVRVTSAIPYGREGGDLRYLL